MTTARYLVFTRGDRDGWAYHHGERELATAVAAVDYLVKGAPSAASIKALEVPARAVVIEIGSQDHTPAFIYKYGANRGELAPPASGVRHDSP